MLDSVSKIRDKMGIPELLAGLAEEASELSQAALKYRRALTQINPTPRSEDEAYQDLIEEIADTHLYLMALYINRNEIKRIEEEKAARWAKRLGVDG